MFAPTTRDQLVRSLFFGFLSAASGFCGCGAVTDRSTPKETATQKPVVTCSATNDVTLAKCEDLVPYQTDCGAICPSGEQKKDHAGCTEFRVDFSQTATSIVGERKVGKQFCVDATVQWVWRYLMPLQTTILNPTFTSTACCSDVCNAEIAAVMAEVVLHEQRHREKVEAAFNKAVAAWPANRAFQACAKNKKQAEIDVRQLIDAAQTQTVDTFLIESTEEPPQPRKPDCANKCKGGTVCCNNMCCGPNETCQNGVCTSGVMCLEGLCPVGYHCRTFTPINPVCCNDFGDCVCPSGYQVSGGLCYKI